MNASTVDLASLHRAATDGSLELLYQPEIDLDSGAIVATLDDKHIALRVHDHGVGIPPQDLKRVFRRFYRVQDRALSSVKGTGLGLFIVQSIAQKHGGRVFAESEGSGKGATITIELPRSAV